MSTKPTTGCEQPPREAGMIKDPQPSAVAPDPVSDTGDRPADYAVLDWNELAWEAGENPHIDVSRLVMAGEAMRRYFEQRLAALEAENAKLRTSAKADDTVAPDIDAMSPMRKMQDAVERLAHRLDKEPGNQTVVALWLHHVQAVDEAIEQQAQRLVALEAERDAIEKVLDAPYPVGPNRTGLPLVEKAVCLVRQVQQDESRCKSWEKSADDANARATAAEAQVKALERATDEADRLIGRLLRDQGHPDGMSEAMFDAVDVYCASRQQQPSPSQTEER